MPPNSAIKCLGNTPGECSYTVLNVCFWKIHPFPMNNQLALKLKIQVTLKNSSFLGLQPSYLVYDIFYKPLYEFNLNGCNSFNTSLLNTKLQSWCLVFENIHCVTWSLSCKQIYHGIKWHSLGEKKISTLFTKAVNIYALALSKYKITYNHFLNEVWLSFIFKSSLILKMQWSYTWSYILSFSPIGCRLPMFLHLPRRNPDHKLTVKQLVQFLRPEFSL